MSALDTPPASTNNTDSVTAQLICARWLLPVDGSARKPDTTHAGSGAGEVLEHHAVLIRDDLIADIGPIAQLVDKYPNANVHDFAHHIVAPGLINAHGHAAMTLLRGCADDYPLMTWLQEHIWPLENALVNAEFVADGTELAVAEMLLSGTTCFADMYFFPNAVANAAEKIGMRAQIAVPILEAPSRWASNAEEYLSKGIALFDDYRYSPLINIAFGPHAPYTVGDDTFRKVAMLAEEVDCNIQLHLHETAAEVADSQSAYGITPIERLSRLGVLGPRTQAVHVTQLDDASLDKLAQSGASVIHCPLSNLKLASGQCDAQGLIDAGITVALGSDGAASSNSLDLFEAMKVASLTGKQRRGDPCAIDAASTLYMATLGGARALGIDHLTGSLQIDKQADLVAIDTRQPGMRPLHSPLSQLVYGSAGRAVSDVWIAGQRKVADGQLRDIDLHALYRRVDEWQALIQRQHANLQHL